MTAEQLKTIRQNAGLTQKALTKLFGCSLRSVQNWEKGTAKPLQIFLDKYNKLLEEQENQTNTFEKLVDDVVSNWKAKALARRELKDKNKVSE